MDPNAPRDPRHLPDRPPPRQPVAAGHAGPGMVHYVEPRSVDEPLGLADLFKMVRRQWWVVAGCVALAVAASLYFSLREAPTWEASALVRIETQSSDPFAGYQSQNWWEDELETEIRVVATSPIARLVVDELGLDFGVEAPRELVGRDLFSSVQLSNRVPTRRYFVERAGANRYSLVAEDGEDLVPISRIFEAGESVSIPGFTFTMARDAELEARGIDIPAEFTLYSRSEDAAIGMVLGGLSVTRPDPSASLIRIAYRGGDRDMVPRITDAMADAFIGQRTQVKKTASRSTAEFLEEQTEALSAQLEAAENELQAFREEAQVLSLETEASTQVARLAELQTEHTALAAERDALRNLLAEIRTSSPGERPDYRKLVAFPSFLSNVTVQDLVRSLTEAETRRTEMRARWRPSHPGIVAIDEQIRSLEDRIGQIGTDYLSTLNDQIATHEAVLGRFGSDLARIPGKELQYARLERRANLLAELYSTLSQQLMQAQVSEAVEDPSARVIEPAVLPFAPVSPKPRRNAMFAAFLGLVAGVGLAFVREQLDYTIREDDDLDQVLGAPVLSRVPTIEIASKNGQKRREALVATRGKASLQSESYRTLRTNVIYARPSRSTREMLITSPGARDGKSVTAANLAVTFAQQGRETLLIDGDLRRSVQHMIFETERRPGLSDLLAGQNVYDEVVHQTAVPNLSLVPAGATSPSPSELLSNPLLDYLVQRAREAFDVVIVDSPPILAVTDATVLAGRLDGVVMVVRAGQTHRKAALESLRQLRQVGAQLLGLVLNDADTEGRYGYSYGYYRDYFENDDEAAESAAADVDFTASGGRPKRDRRRPQVMTRAETDRWLSNLLADEDRPGEES